MDAGEEFRPGQASVETDERLRASPSDVEALAEEVSSLREEILALRRDLSDLRVDFAAACTALLVGAGKVSREDAYKWVRENLAK